MKKVIAHKGGANLYPENSKDAILHSYEDYSCDGTEIDVRMTKDHVLVIMHDIDTFRSGNQLKLIRNHTYDELKNVLVRPHRIDWYLQYCENLISRDPIHDRYNLQLLSRVKQKRSYLMTLKEALMLLPKDHELVVEYKGTNEDYDAHETYQRILFDTIAPYSNKNVKIKGYDSHIGMYLKEKLGNVAVGTLVNRKTIANIDYPFDFVSIQNQLLLNQRELYQKCVSYHNRSRDLYVWTLDRYQDFLACSRFFEQYQTMPNIITNNPKVMYQLMNLHDVYGDQFEEQTKQEEMQKILNHH